MTKQPINMIALIATVSVCVIVDGGLLLFSVWLAEGIGKGILFFLVGGAPPTFVVSPSLYAWFKERYPVHA
jgi:hypothetical protein